MADCCRHTDTVAVEAAAGALEPLLMKLNTVRKYKTAYHCLSRVVERLRRKKNSCCYSKLLLDIEIPLILVVVAERSASSANY